MLICLIKLILVIMNEPVKKKRKSVTFREDEPERKKTKRAKGSEQLNFHEMGLDDRILQAIAKQQWADPTPIQEKAIPLALAGKDLLARARTGSGKTAAFLIPAVQKILESKNTINKQEISTLVLAPTKELCSQIYKDLIKLTSSCSLDVTGVDISTPVDLDVQRPLLTASPDIIISTPARLMLHIRAGNLDLSQSVDILIVDEADLIFSFGFEKDMTKILKHIPQIHQSILMSATLTEDVLSLKRLVLHNPVILKLQEPQLPGSDQLIHYYIHVDQKEKFIILYTLLKLGLVAGKTLIFVSSVDRSYKVKLFLEQVGISCCILNGELPLESRCHIVSQFNSGVYDIIIASDERLLDESKASKFTENKESKKIQNKKESGVSRGVDFQFVSNVINFDIPFDVNAYIHRVGRTARVQNKGTALSLIGLKEQNDWMNIELFIRGMYPEDTKIIQKFKFDMTEVEGFRYRALGVYKSINRNAIKAARLKEIKQELLNSEKLKVFFDENPREKTALRHDSILGSVKGYKHLKNVPDYIKPESLKDSTTDGTTTKVNNKNKNHKKFKSTQKSNKLKRKSDPLKSMKFKGFNKSI